ncbi:MAG TPA: CdaR family protein [Terriglobales bacterium]|jgi:YbbR domain-containing protein|nr:CdaR family protein [Terriglobales bacterium]
MTILRNYVWNNIGLKVLSLSAAVLLWSAVAHEPAAEVVLNVPIEFHNAPENLEISSERVPQAQVRVRGPVNAIRQLTPSEIHTVVDLEKAKPGERTYDLNPQQIGIPTSLEVVQVVPGQFRISLDQRASRQVEVQPRVTGDLASGYRIARVTTDPPTVLLSGPERHVQSVEAAITDPIDATGVVGRATFTAKPYVTDPMVRVVSPSAVRVTVITAREH